MKLYQIAHFYDPYLKSKLLFKIEIFGPPQRIPIFPIFQGFCYNLAQKSRTGKSLPNINHLLELGKCFPTIYEQIL